MKCFLLFGKKLHYLRQTTCSKEIISNINININKVADARYIKHAKINKNKSVCLLVSLQWQHLPKGRPLLSVKTCAPRRG